MSVFLCVLLNIFLFIIYICIYFLKVFGVFLTFSLLRFLTCIFPVVSALSRPNLQRSARPRKTAKKNTGRDLPVPFRHVGSSRRPSSRSTASPTWSA